MKTLMLHSMNLQKFTEGPTPPNPGADPADKKDKEKLKPGNPEFDAAVSRAVETALENSNKKWEKVLAEQVNAAKEQGKTEAEKMAQMNEEQRLSYEAEQREKKLQERESEITRRELRAQSAIQLTQDKLPAELLEVLDYSTGENCQASYDKIKAAFEKATGSFEEAVKAEVNKRLASSVDNPLGGAGAPSTVNPWAEETLNLMEQARILKENPQQAEALQKQAKK